VISTIHKEIGAVTKLDWSLARKSAAAVISVGSACDPGVLSFFMALGMTPEGQ
jgi:hypothetical protein